MRLSDFANEEVKTEAEAYAFVESKVWPNGPVCPRCASERCGPLRGASTRLGVYKCYGCRKPFRVTIGTPLHSAHVRLDAVCRAVALTMRGCNAAEIGRATGLGHISAWRLLNKIRRDLQNG